MLRLIRAPHMLDFVMSDLETHLLLLMEWASPLRHLPTSSCFKFLCLLFLEESRLVLTSLGVFIAHGGGVHTVKWWITGAESWLQAWFTAGQHLNHSTQPDAGLQHFSCLDNSCWCIHFSENESSLRRVLNTLFCNLECTFASLFLVSIRWESLQVSTLQCCTEGLPWLLSGWLPLRPLANQQRSFLSTAAHQQQLQPQSQARACVQGRLEPGCRSLPRPGKPWWKRPACRQAVQPPWQRGGGGRLFVQEVPVWASGFVHPSRVCHVPRCTGADGWYF